MSTQGVRILFAIWVVVITGCAETWQRESTGQYMDDTTITTKVKSALVNNPDVSALDINVETYKGTVQLSGFANTEQERQAAATIARSVGGVSGVKNNVVIKPR